MEWVNYHHLLYFWVVAREGGLAPAGKVLRLSHPTLSAQIHTLERQLGEKLFEKSGRRLQLTEMGRVVYRYAEEIFTLGREMIDTVRGRATGKPLRLTVGVVDAVPKQVVRLLLAPALAMEGPVKLVCHEGPYERLLGDLALHALDLVIADAPIPEGTAVKAFHHVLGETEIGLFAAPSLAEELRPGFPRSLDGAPALLPLEQLTLRRALDAWFDRLGVRPRVVAEFEDSALSKVFGADGAGFFAAPSVVARDVCRQYGVQLVGKSDVRERFYAITVERRLSNPAVRALCDAARRALEGAGKQRGRKPALRTRVE